MTGMHPESDCPLDLFYVPFWMVPSWNRYIPEPRHALLKQMAEALRYIHERQTITMTGFAVIKDALDAYDGMVEV